MNCEECLDLITAYLDDEIAAKEARDFEEHLLACDACRSEFQQMRMVTDAVRSLPEVDLPLGFHGI
jgi:anti-sigma factor RsiW